MNILHRVTLAELKRNRTRTVVTIVGILLSAAMFCALTTFLQSFFRYMQEGAVYQSGDWYGMSQAVDADTLQKLREDSRTVKLSTLEYQGYAEVDSENQDKPYLYVGGADEAFFQNMPVHLTAGRLPGNSTELLLPEHLAVNGGVQAALGDTLTLQLGDRTLSGKTLYQDTAYQDGSADDTGAATEKELFVARETRTYTVVGFYERPDFENYDAPGYTALTVSDGGGTVWAAYSKLDRPGDIYAYMEEHQLGTATNGRLLAYSGASRYDNFYSMLYNLTAILAVLIVLGSVSLIYNAFSISVSERTRQFGLLALSGRDPASGAAERILRSGVVSAIGIPLGIGVGIGGIAVTLALLSQRIRSFTGMPVCMHVSVSWWSVLGATALALLTVCISAWIPARRAAKIHPIEAIRQSTDIRVRPREVKTAGWIRKIFGLEGMIASKHYKRSRKRYRATVLSLFMSIVLFISASSFSAYLGKSVEGSSRTYAFDIYMRYGVADASDTAMQFAFAALADTEGVGTAEYTASCTMQAKVPSSDLTNAYQTSGASVSYPYAAVYFVEDSVYQAFLQENGLDPAVYMNAAHAVPVFMDTVTEFRQDEGKFVTRHAFTGAHPSVALLSAKERDGCSFQSFEDGEACYIRNDTNETVRVPAEEAATEIPLDTADAAFVSQAPDCAMYGDSLLILFPYSAMQTVLGDASAQSNTYFTFTAGEHAAVYQRLRQKAVSMGCLGSIQDYAEDAESNRNLIFVVNVFAYGFIVLISLICIANVFNTISTNIALRRREFAMLRSVGMTQKGMRRMLNYECLLYGTRALLLGLPVAALFTYWIYRALDIGYETPFFLPWNSIAIAVVSVFAVVFSSMLYAMRRIRTENPINALKDENL